MDRFDIKIVNQFRNVDCIVNYLNKYFAANSDDTAFYEFQYKKGRFDQVIKHEKSALQKTFRKIDVRIRNKRFNVFRQWIKSPNQRIISQKQLNLFYQKGLLTENTNIVEILNALKEFINAKRTAGDKDSAFWLIDFYNHYKTLVKNEDDGGPLKRNKYMKEIQDYFRNNDVEITRVQKGNKKKKGINASLNSLSDLVNGSEEDVDKILCLDNCPYFHLHVSDKDFEDIFFDTELPKNSTAFLDEYKTYSLLEKHDVGGHSTVYKISVSGEPTDVLINNTNAKVLLIFRVNKQTFRKNYIDTLEDENIEKITIKGQKCYYVCDSPDIIKQKVLNGYCLYCKE